MIDLQAIAKRYRPRGWRLQYSKHRTKVLSGLCDFEKKTIYAPYIQCPETLYVFLHECAHATLHNRPGINLALREFEAEKWAISTLRREGVPVSKHMIEQAKKNVRDTAAKTGDVVPSYVRRWIK